MIHSYKELIVWQRAMELVSVIYSLTAPFPKEEKYGLISQLRRAAIAIPSNIAEGRYRGTKKDYSQYLRIAFGSGAELETLLEIAKGLSNTKGLQYARVDSLLKEVMKMLNAMIRDMNPKNQ